MSRAFTRHVKRQDRTINGRDIKKREKNGLGLCAHRAVVYDHVFWLKVDSEPAARDLFAEPKFIKIGQRCLKQNF